MQSFTDQQQTSLSKLEPDVAKINNLLNGYFQVLADKSNPDVKYYTLMNYTENPEHKKIIDKILTLKLKYPFLEVIGRSSPDDMVQVGGKKTHKSRKKLSVYKKRSTRRNLKKIRHRRSKRKPM